MKPFRHNSLRMKQDTDSPFSEEKELTSNNHDQDHGREEMNLCAHVIVQCIVEHHVTIQCIVEHLTLKHLQTREDNFPSFSPAHVAYPQALTSILLLE